MAEPGELTTADVPKLSEEDLRTVDQHLHRRYAEAREKGEATEYPWVNLHVAVVEEMERRGLDHPDRDDLDRETQRLRQAKAAGVEKRLADIEAGLAALGEIVLVPHYVSLVGSAAVKDDPGDLDVLMRDEDPRKGWRESVWLAVRRALDPAKSGKKLHVLCNPQGPHLVPGQPYVPLFDLVLRPHLPLERVGIEKAVPRSVKPIQRYTAQKPLMLGYTEFFSAQELWEKWAKDRAPVLVSPKVDGLRTIVQKAGDRVTICFEDAKEDRTDQLPELAAAVRKLSKDAIFEGELQAYLDDGYLARPQLLGMLAGDIKAHPVLFLYDVLYWGEDVHDRPFRERLPIIRAIVKELGEYAVALPQIEAGTEAELERASRRCLEYEDPHGGRPAIEGVVAREPDMPYVFGATDRYAKFKLYVELKVRVKAVEQKQNGYTYDCQLRADKGDGYVDIGKTFVSEQKLADEGDTLNVGIEELLLYPDGHVAWGKPTPLGPDRSRPAYTVRQAIDLARRGRVLKVVREVQKAEAPEGEETRGERAAKNWHAHWQEAMPLSGRALPFILHAHWRGLSEDEAKNLDLEQLLETDHSLHFDLRLGTDRFRGWWGITLFAGETAENRDELRIFRMQDDPDEKLESAPKEFGPPEWLKVGVQAPLVVEPAGVGSTSKKWAKFFCVDRGVWRLGFAREHAVEIWLEGRRLKGRYVWQYAQLGGRRAWLFTRPKDQRPYAATHKLEDVVRELRAKGQRWLVWPKDPEHLEKGCVLIDLQKEAAEKARYRIAKADEERRYTLGVAYPASRIDAHGEFASPEELEEAAWHWLANHRRIGLQHQDGTEGHGIPVESYIYRGPDWHINGQVVRAGDWLLGVIWDEAAWDLIKRGILKGYSIQGEARRERASPEEVKRIARAPEAPEA